MQQNTRNTSTTVNSVNHHFQHISAEERPRGVDFSPVRSQPLIASNSELNQRVQELNYKMRQQGESIEDYTQRMRKYWRAKRVQLNMRAVDHKVMKNISKLKQCKRQSQIPPEVIDLAQDDEEEDEKEKLENGCGKTPKDQKKFVEFDNSQANDSDNEDICPICLKSLNNKMEVTTLRCDHKFHFPCIRDWFIKNITCPVCRRDFITK